MRPHQQWIIFGRRGVTSTWLRSVQGKQPECIFCDAVQLNRDEETLIVQRGKKSFVILESVSVHERDT